MTKLQQSEACDLARSIDDLSVVEITHGRNGYPEGLGDRAILGFETFAQAEEFSDGVGGEVCEFRKKNGWTFWEKKGTAAKEFDSDIYLYRLGDNYSQAGTEELENIKESILGVIEKFNGDFSDIEKFIEEKKQLLEAIDNCGEDEIVISTHGRLYEVVNKTMMRYHEDVTTYEIGVLLERDTD